MGLHPTTIDTHFEQCDHVRAIFQPRNLETLKPEAHGIIGQEFEFEALWEIEVGETYAGEYAMGFATKEDARMLAIHADFCWVPSGDLTILEVLEATWEPATNGMKKRVWKSKQS